MTVIKMLLKINQFFITTKSHFLQLSYALLIVQRGAVGSLNTAAPSSSVRHRVSAIFTTDWQHKQHYLLEPRLVTDADTNAYA